MTIDENINQDSAIKTLSERVDFILKRYTTINIHFILTRNINFIT